jgi:dUTP pyrophosphatase
MDGIIVKVKKLNEDVVMPLKATEFSSGFDLYANIKEKIIIKPLERKLINSGMIMEIPNGYEGQIRPRSSLALKNGVTVLNSPGTIDCDYRGEVKILLINLSPDEFVIQSGDRIAQIVFTKVSDVKILEMDSFQDTVRGDGGFGSTGK